MLEFRVDSIRRRGDEGGLTHNQAFVDNMQDAMNEDLMENDDNNVNNVNESQEHLVVGFEEDQVALAREEP